MKKLLVMMGALALATATAFAAGGTTALDTVGVAYSSTGVVVMLGIDNENLVELGWTRQLEAGGIAGARATFGSGSGAAEATGGSLLYTLHGTVEHKITVQKDSSTANGYVANSLSVSIYRMQVGGSADYTLGTPTATYNTVANSGTFVGIGDTAQDFITGIRGADTWTGTTTQDGANLYYRLTSNPAVGAVVVLYSILEDFVPIAAPPG
ncbi:MAG: hypothetical protein WCL50_00160 [Spirochaetota bacterium]